MSFDERPAPSQRDLANAIRFLTVDTIEAAGTGHPGTAMGMADIAEVLWNRFLKHNPADPSWIDRDRFVQSNGHGAMLIYSLLHLSGYDLSLEDLKAHRKPGSRTPGHPEYGITPGVETTTGPLGQGFANAVGMALAERKLAAEFNRDDFPVIDHHTYVFVGDGCLMEGVAQEAASLAGALGLGRLIAFYDDNGISIDGDVRAWFADDTPARFRALGWHVVSDVDGHNPGAVEAAIEEARGVHDRPSLICCRTIIGFGAPTKQGKEEVHGAPLGAAEAAATREALGWPYPPHEVPSPIRTGWDARKRGADRQAAWGALFARYRATHPDLAAELQRRMAGEAPVAFASAVAAYADALLAEPPVRQPLRKASSKVLARFTALLPELIGGSADLSQSTLAWTAASRSIMPEDFAGNFIHYGVREFGMSAVMNGMAAHGGLIPFGSTYLVFSDYARNAVRLAALMKLKAIFLYTHDSIGVGEDGPTHQPAEQLLALRAIPGLSLWRPGSELEALLAWEDAVGREGPSVIVAARQDGSAITHSGEHRQAIRRGGYVLSEPTQRPDLVLAGTGSELGLVTETATHLAAEGIHARVVSIPNANIFAEQPMAYRDAVLPPGLPSLFVEAASSIYWYQFLRGPGAVVGIDAFGESAPGPLLYQHFGLTAEAVAARARTLLAVDT
ncbi:transketolase [Labrys portucalensis]|uniref:Transketolase n=1 Tax=Labrys neptuniae TaxID=376174 RepID=A0ABV6ZJF9_9HYPH